MNASYSNNATPPLPPLIRTVLEERRGEYRRIFRGLIVVISTLIIGLVVVFPVSKDEGMDALLILGLAFLVLMAFPLFFLSYYHKNLRLFDDCLNKGKYSVVSGMLDGIQRLKKKQVCYIIDGRIVNGTLMFRGYGGWANIRVEELVSGMPQPVQLYLLPGNLIAGATYPETDPLEPVRRVVSREDWLEITQGLLGWLVLFGWISLIVSLLLLATCGFIEWQIGDGWKYFWEMIVGFNAILLFILGIIALANLSTIRALLNKNEPTAHIQVYRGLPMEWYLTRTRARSASGATTSSFSGWVRLSGVLHKVQYNLTSRDRDFLGPMRKPIQVEYLVYKRRLISLYEKHLREYSTLQ